MIVGQEGREVTWGIGNVSLSNPSVEQCQEVISKLKDNHQYNSITLRNSSPDIVQLLVPPLLKIRIITLHIYYLHTPLTHDAILSFSSSLSANKSLLILSIAYDSINDDGVITLVESLKPNDTLIGLYLENNSGITSASAQSLAELLLTNHTLTDIWLDNTNIDTNGVLVLMESLKTNKTLRTLQLERKHELTCSTLPYHEQIKDRLRF